MLTLRAGSDLASPFLLLVSGLMDGDGEAAAVVRRGGLGGPWAASDALFPCGLGARGANGPGSSAAGVAGAVGVGREFSLVFLCSHKMHERIKHYSK